MRLAAASMRVRSSLCTESAARKAEAPRAARGVFLPLYLCRLDLLLYHRQLAVGNQPLPWTAIKHHIGAVRSLKDSDNGPTATFREITVFPNYANANAHLKAVR